MMSEKRTTPKVKVAIMSFRLLLLMFSIGNDATSATDKAPLIPPSTTICLHALGIFSRVNLFIKDKIGYVEIILAKNMMQNANTINPIF